MAFWGIEVKPGRPVTHSFHKTSRRLRISQATLGIGSVTTKTLVQCNVGQRSPVFLCALLPDKMESCHLDLEFEEPHDVVFSVIGPRSVYLTGYYVSDNRRHSTAGSDSETYGEDIAFTASEESGHNIDEDKYEDSFIDDDDELEVFPHSPVSSDQDHMMMPGKTKMRVQKGNSNLQRKRMQIFDSDPESTSQEGEDEDNFVLSVFKSEKTAKRTKSKVEEKNGKGTIETDGNKADCGTSDGISNEKPDGLMMRREAERKDLPADNVKEEEIKPKESWKHLAKEADTREDNFVNHWDGLVNTKPQEENGKVDNCENLIASNEDQRERGPAKKKKLKRKRKGQPEEVKPLGGSSDSHLKALKEDETLQIEAEIDGKSLDINQSDKDACKPIVDGNSIGSVTLARVEVRSEDYQNPKKRRKAATEERSVQTDNGTCNNIQLNDHFDQPVLEASNMDKDLCPVAEEYKKSTTDSASDPVVQECKLEKAKKKKKKSKARVTDSNFSNNASILSEIENKKSPLKLEEKNYENGTSLARTLSNGLTIQELASGDKDGKMATLGRKVKVFYTAKLKSSGHVFDSNMDKAPYKFRLGDETVIEGWNVGLQGMRVGGKRRLTVPPSMGFGCQGAGENIPPNSWLEYEVELVNAR